MWALAPLGVLNLVAVIAISAFAVLNSAFREILRPAVIEVCCSARLIAMASAVLGIVAEWGTQSVPIGLAAFLASWAIQWFVLHNWAVSQKHRKVVSWGI